MLLVFVARRLPYRCRGLSVYVAFVVDFVSPSCLLLVLPSCPCGRTVLPLFAFVFALCCFLSCRFFSCYAFHSSVRLCVALFLFLCVPFSLYFDTMMQIRGSQARAHRRKPPDSYRRELPCTQTSTTDTTISMAILDTYHVRLQGAWNTTTRVSKSSTHKAARAPSA